MKDLEALLEKAKGEFVGARATGFLGQWAATHGPELLDALTSLLEENRRLQSERDQFDNLLMDAKEERDMEKSE